MRHTNYFCDTCYKTFSEWWSGSYLCDQKGNPTAKDSPLSTGKCDCGGKLTID